MAEFKGTSAETGPYDALLQKYLLADHAILKNGKSLHQR
jgi:hypothetical protein